MSELYKNKYRIPSARAAWHDYDGGVYFVTICTANHEHFFGEIVNENGMNKMVLSDVGKFATTNIANATAHYPYAEIPLWVVMPNHMHLIVIIDNEKIPYNRTERIDTQFVETRRAIINPANGDRNAVETRRATSLQGNDKMRYIANMQGWLSVVVGGLKSAITKFANQNAIPFAWQPRFHDHIVREKNELNRIAEYIETNVDNWNLDEYNT